jgi:hypothetical protein
MKGLLTSFHCRPGPLRQAVVLYLSLEHFLFTFHSTHSAIPDTVAQTMSSHPEKDSTVSGTLAVACSTAGCSTVSQGSMPSRWDKEKRKSAKAHYVCTECLTRTNDTRLDNYTKSGSEVTFRNDGFRARFLDMKDIGRRQGDEESSMLDALKTAQLNKWV